MTAGPGRADTVAGKAPIPHPLTPTQKHPSLPGSGWAGRRERAMGARPQQEQGKRHGRHERKKGRREEGKKERRKENVSKKFSHAEVAGHWWCLTDATR